MRELGHDLISLEDARETMLSLVGVIDTESCATPEAVGRVLRQAVEARDLIPPFDNSAMDGYAVQAADLAAATEDHPVTLPVAFRLQAGEVAAEPLAAGSAVRIMTGAPLPPGAEAVVPHELTKFTDTEVTFSDPIKAGRNVRPAGGDMRPGDVPLGPGAVLGPSQLGIAATLGYASLEVSRRPRVAILSPGDELVDIAEQPGPGKIRNSNACSLRAAVIESGCEPIDLGIIPDNTPAIREAISAAIERGADALVSTGGASAGDFDFIKEVVSEDADPAHVFKVAMKPGKPQVFGLFDGRPFFGLPGNPAAAIVSFEVFVRPGLRKLQGCSRVLPELFEVRFPFEQHYKPGRVFLLRTRVEPSSEGGGYEVVRPGEQDSSFLASLARANAIVVLPPEGGPVPEGATRPAFWMGGAAR
ncbi:MAG: gephyrin-like molybdotransferase Glp [Planctomycetota bacterium]|nr:gephyrin-like molybdotransferase Glp [Planctomycetota bacterium]